MMDEKKPFGWVVVDELGVHLFTGNMPRRGLSCWMGNYGVDGQQIKLTEKERHLWEGLTPEDDPRPVYLSLHSLEEVKDGD